MRSVPQSLREGAFGLGASKFQVALRVVFPAALSGIVASIVLAMSRAVGETMVVLIAGGQQPQWGVNVGTVDGDAHRVHRRDRQGRRPPRARSPTRRSSRSGTTLFVITLVINIISIRFVRKYRQVYE